MAVAGSSDILAQNLQFFRRMRNFYYEKAGRLFRQLQATVMSTAPDALDSAQEILLQYIQVLDLTSEYARHTIRGHKRRKIRTFRQDRESGVMEEEIVFVCLLEELLSSSIYLRNRFETNDHVRRYRALIENRNDYVGDRRGFLSNILTHLEADQQADHEEIVELTKLIHKRFQIANSVFAIVETRDLAAPPSA